MYASVARERTHFPFEAPRGSSELLRHRAAPVESNIRYRRRLARPCAWPTCSGRIARGATSSPSTASSRTGSRTAGRAAGAGSGGPARAGEVERNQPGAADRHRAATAQAADEEPAAIPDGPLPEIDAEGAAGLGGGGAEMNMAAQSPTVSPVLHGPILAPMWNLCGGGGQQPFWYINSML